MSDSILTAMLSAAITVVVINSVQMAQRVLRMERRLKERKLPSEIVPSRRFLPRVEILKGKRPEEWLEHLQRTYSDKLYEDAIDRMIRDYIAKGRTPR